MIQYFSYEGINLDNLKFIHQNRQIEYFHLEYQNLLPFFEQLGSLEEDHKNIIQCLLVIHDHLNNNQLHNCE